MPAELAIAVTVFIGGGVIFLSSVVVARYWLDWRRLPPEARVGRKLLPLHVWLVALSYDLLVLLIVLSGILGKGNLGDWRAGVRIPALLMGLAAMFVMVNFQRKTYRRDARTKDDSDDQQGSRG